MKSGAADYISKPFDVEELKVVVQKALEKAELVDENIFLRRELEDAARVDGAKIGRVARRIVELGGLNPLAR